MERKGGSPINTLRSRLIAPVSRRVLAGRLGGMLAVAGFGRRREGRAAMTASEPQAPDLGAVFDAHVRHEFVDQDVEATMRTMAAEPYVFHVPTMTGGYGREQVRDFYSRHFIGHWPDDVEVTQVSRTVGAEQVVDELVMRCTHDREVPALLPGVSPTGRRIALPHVVVMGFKDGRVAHEHIYWDQATLLAQAGLIDGAGLPVTGAEQASGLLERLAPEPADEAPQHAGPGAHLDPGHPFIEQDVDRAMAAVAADAYVYNVPTGQGGDGRAGVERFYRERLVGHMPADTAVVPLSRTIGASRVVDELIVSFTHDVPIGFMLPGIAPTGRKIALPLVVVTGFAGDKVAFEHVYWDQGSLLVQVGLLDPARVPAAGAEPAAWLSDRSPPLNRLLER